METPGGHSRGRGGWDPRGDEQSSAPIPLIKGARPAQRSPAPCLQHGDQFSRGELHKAPACTVFPGCLSSQASLAFSCSFEDSLNLPPRNWGEKCVYQNTMKRSLREDERALVPELIGVEDKIKIMLSQTWQCVHSIKPSKLWNLPGAASPISPVAFTLQASTDGPRQTLPTSMCLFSRGRRQSKAPSPVNPGLHFGFTKVTAKLKS